jgi:hypothetical protein
MAQKVLARIEATSLERAGRDLAVAIVTACGADDGDDVILIAPSIRSAMTAWSLHCG